MKPFTPSEYKLTSLRECPVPDELIICDEPSKAVAYWNLHVVQHPLYNPDVECLVVLLLNTRTRIKGHVLISTGVLDQLLVHAREVFRPAIVSASYAVVLMHNHPSGDSTPSDADVKVTRDLVRAGQIIHIEVHDHIVVGHGQHKSLRELGYMYA